jgi:hypothetical protein
LRGQFTVFPTSMIPQMGKCARREGFPAECPKMGWAVTETSVWQPGMRKDSAYKALRKKELGAPTERQESCTK